MQRHIGKLRNTEQRCIVVFMQVPGREDHALVVVTDGLNNRIEQSLMSIVESNEGQHEQDLGVVLGRRVMPDTGERVIEALHNRGLLRAVPVDQVMMLPRPNMPFPLRSIIEQMGRHIPGSTPATVQAEAERYNPHVHNSNALDIETKTAIARNLLAEADLLAAEVNLKREKAYAYAPNLRPGPNPVQTSPFPTDLQTIGIRENVSFETAEAKAKVTRKPRAAKPKVAKTPAGA